jgi:transcriptional regulator with XRE-family HTH domain
MDNKSIFSKRLMKQRIALEYTQETFSEKVGMSRARYANYEQSRREPDFAIVKLFADHLKCTTDYFLGKDDEIAQKIVDQMNCGNEQKGTEQTFNISQMEKLSYDEVKLIEKYRKMKESQKELIHKVADEIAPTDDNEKKKVSGK